MLLACQFVAAHPGLKREVAAPGVAVQPLPEAAATAAPAVAGQNAANGTAVDTDDRTFGLLGGLGGLGMGGMGLGGMGMGSMGMGYNQYMNMGMGGIGSMGGIGPYGYGK